MGSAPDALRAIDKIDHWGVRRLAYEISGHSTGYYVVVQFSTASEISPEFERAIKLNDNVIRYLIVVQQIADTLPILLDPGTASPDEIGEFLAELSILYRMVGGSGIEFRMDDVAIPAFV
jgi:hypothetical protein